MKIAIDFDGTCVTHAYPKIGKTINKAVEVMKELVKQDHKLFLFTVRSGPELQAAVDWFIGNNIKLSGIQKDPSQHIWTKSNKCYAQLYIDDAALGCPLINPENDRSYVNWFEVEKFLKEKGIL